MFSDNFNKSRHGIFNKKTLEYILDISLEMAYISKLEKNYSKGMTGFQNQNQFKANFLISFPDATEWILYSSSSIRSDRVKESCWDALNLKNINSKIKKAYLIYPDGLISKEKNTAILQNKKILEHKEFSSLDGIISQDEIFSFIEGYALQGKSKGQISDIIGNNFEKRIAAILKYPYNLEKWKTNDPTIEGVHFDVFDKILSCFDLDKNKICEIDATSDKKIIGYLPSGGAAKTDVLATIKDLDGNLCYKTISCKRSGNVSTSVHQYTANEFSRVLDSNNQELKRILEIFQQAGNKKDMGEENALKLQDLLKPYLNKLVYWVLGGINGDGNPQTQWANYIVTYNNATSKTSVHTLSDYTQLIQTNNTGAFGTPFSWTYQGKRGKNIQLKCKLLD